MKEFKKKLKCKICGRTVECRTRSLYSVMYKMWKIKHQECKDIQYIFNVQVSFRGGGSAWKL